jgi:hypothetical protein
MEGKKMGQIDLNYQLKDMLDNAPLVVQEKKNGEYVDIPVTVRKLIVDALLAPEDIPVKKKMERYNLAVSVAGTGLITFEEKDLKLIKDLCGKRYTPLIVGQLFAILDA